MLRVALVAAPGALAAAGACLLTELSLAAEAPEPLRWRMLLIVKTATDVSLADHPRLRGHLTRQDVPVGEAAVDVSRTRPERLRAEIAGEDLAAIERAFTGHAPHWVRELSRGRVEWETVVQHSKEPVRSVTTFEQGEPRVQRCWLGPDDVRGDLDGLVRPGEYDGVFVYWKGEDPSSGEQLHCGFGWTIPASAGTSRTGFSSVSFGPKHVWTRGSEWTEVFVHEWLHQLEFHYGALGVPLPRGGLHAGAEHGYGKEGRGRWPWFADYINGVVGASGGSPTGLGERAWRLGTMRGRARQ